MNTVRKIISGGQTGVDRAALDAAMDNGIEIGGYVPRGRLAEDGTTPRKYVGLIETSSAEYAERTKLNVLHSDATLLLTRGVPAGGSKLTASIAVESDGPFLHLDLSKHGSLDPLDVLIKWLEKPVRVF